MPAGDVTERSKIVRRFLQEAVQSIPRTFLEERQRISNQNEWTRDPCLRMGRCGRSHSEDPNPRGDRPLMFQLDAGFIRAAPCLRIHETLHVESLLTP